MEDDIEPTVMATTPERAPAPENMASNTRQDPTASVTSTDMDDFENHEDKVPESPKRLVTLRYNVKSEEERAVIRNDGKEIAKEDGACHSNTQTFGQDTHADSEPAQNSDSIPKSSFQETVTQETAATATDKNSTDDETPEGQISEEELGLKVLSKRAATEAPHEINNDGRQPKKARTESPEGMRADHDTEMTGLDALGGQQQVCDPHAENFHAKEQIEEHTNEAQKQAENDKTERPHPDICTKNAPAEESIKKEADTEMTEADIQGVPEHIDEQRELGTSENVDHVNQARVDEPIHDDSNTAHVEMDASSCPESTTKQHGLHSATNDDDLKDARVESPVKNDSANGHINANRVNATNNSDPKETSVQDADKNPFNFIATKHAEQFKGYKDSAAPGCSKDQIKQDQDKIKNGLKSFSSKEWKARNGNWGNRTLAVDLYSYQVLGVGRMKELEQSGNGGLLADEMGLGKTAQIIALVVLAPAPAEEKPKSCAKPKEISRPNASKHSDGDDDDDGDYYPGDESDDSEPDADDLCPRSNCTLIVGPPRSSKQLLHECKRFVPRERKISINAYSRKIEQKMEEGDIDINIFEKSDFLITTYGEVVAAFKRLLGLLRRHKLELKGDWQRQLRRKGAGEEIPTLFAIKFWRVVLDESHQIRNPKTQRSQACHALQREKSWCVSGTPYINSQYDFYSQMKFAGDVDSEDREHFKAAYCSSEEGDVLSMEKFKHIMIRRTAQDTLFGHPVIPKIEAKRFEVKIELTASEKAFIQLVKNIYDRIAEKAKEEGEQLMCWALQSLLRQRQAISSPFILESFMVKNHSKSELEEIQSMYAALRLEIDMLPNINRELGKARVAPRESDQPLLSSASQAEDELDMGDMFNVSINDKKHRCIICRKTCKDIQSLECGHVFCKMCMVPHLVWDRENIPHARCPACKKICAVVQNQENDSDSDDLNQSAGNLDKPTSEDDKEDEDQEGYWASAVEETMKAAKSKAAKSKRAKQEGEKPPETRPGYDYRGFHPKLDEHETRWLQEADLVKDQTLLRRGKIGPCADLCEKISKQHPDDKIIAFTQFTQEAALVGRVLQHLGITFIYINGQMTRKQTDDALKEMAENPKIKVMVTALKCGGESLNCQFANHAILMDPYWNIALEEQAIGRVKRMGQKKTVYVHRIIAKGTADEVVSKIQERKKDEAERLIGDLPAQYFQLTMEDVTAALK